MLPEEPIISARKGVESKAVPIRDFFEDQLVY